MEQKLNKLYLECINELNKIGTNILDEKQYGKIDISISKRNNKRYGCCKQEFYRQRLSKNFTLEYRCGKCKGKFEIIKLI